MSITHQTDQQRFIYQENGRTAYLSYRPLSGSLNAAGGQAVYAFDHTVVPPELGGRGIGTLLAGAALDYARSQNWRVRPDCSFVAHFIAKHPQYADLLAE